MQDGTEIARTVERLNAISVVVGSLLVQTLQPEQRPVVFNALNGIQGGIRLSQRTHGHHHPNPEDAQTGVEAFQIKGTTTLQWGAAFLLHLVSFCVHAA